MSISHEEAQHLIQQNMEDQLDRQALATLTAHLRVCRECRAYASEIEEVSDLLAPVMKRQWSFQPASLSIPALLGRRERINSRTLLIIRKSASGLLLVAFFLSAWQFVISGSPVS